MQLKSILIGFLLYSLTGSSLLAQNSKRPNILICIADDQSFPHAGIYGTSWIKTPAFDRVAREGVLFMRAYTPNAKCSPSRSSILTGRNSWELEEAANHVPFFPAKFKTFPEALKENGYHTGYTGKGWAPGNSGEVNGKERELIGNPYNTFKKVSPTKHISTNDYVKNFESFLDDNSDEKPFYFWFGSFEPHRGYEYGSSLKKGNKRLQDIKVTPSFWPDNDTTKIDMLDYAYEIEYFDQNLQKMLDVLEEKGMLDNTLIIVTSDNGMPFPRAKGQVYELSNHLPLAIMWGTGIENPGRIVNDFVSFIDFAPTFLEVAGIDSKKSGMKGITGKSLTDILFSRKDGLVNPERDAVLVGKERHDVGRPDDEGYPVRGIVSGDYLYLHNFEADRWPVGNPETGYLDTDASPIKTAILNQRRYNKIDIFWQQNFGKRPTEELYNISEDPECIDNLAMNERQKSRKDSLKNRLFSELKRQKDPRMLGNGKIFDEYEYANPRFKGFYERYMKGDSINPSWVNPSDFEKESVVD